MKKLIIVFTLCLTFAYGQSIEIRVTQVKVDRIYQDLNIKSYVKNVNTTYYIDALNREVIVSFNKSDRNDVVFQNVKIQKIENTYIVSYNDISLYTNDNHVGTITIDTKLNKVVYDDQNVDKNFSDVYDFQVFDVVVRQPI